MFVVKYLFVLNGHLPLIRCVDSGISFDFACIADKCQQRNCPFEDGDVRTFLEDLKDVAEVVGVKTNRGKLAALRTLVKGRAKAVLDAARRGPAKMEWAAAKETLVAAFDSPADRQEAMRRFKAARLGQGADPSVFATTLQGLLDRALPGLDQESRRQLLTEQFIEGLPMEVRDQVRIAHVARPMDLDDLAKVTRELAVMSVASVDSNSNTDKKTLEVMQKAMEQLAADRSKNKVFRDCSFCWAGRLVMGAIEKGAVHTRVEVDGEVEQCLVDTGAAISLIARAEKQNLEPTSMMIKTVGGHSLLVDGVKECGVRIGGHIVKHRFIVSPETRQTILGADFLAATDAVIDLKLKKLSTKYGSLTLIGQRKDSVNQVRKVKTPSCTAPLLQSTVEKYAEVFTTDDDPYGFCNWIAHEIPTTGTFRPHGPRRIPVHLEEELRRQIQNMLSEDVIEEANSPYNSPVLLVKKSNGKYRFCVDFRRLNEVTQNTVVPIPSVADIFDKLQQAKLFTVLDLRSGYWQVPIKPTDREKTAFTVGEKQYQFKRMPFGLSGAPFTFRRLMVQLVKRLDNVAVYGDDIVIYSNTESEHAAHIDAVLNRIKNSGLRINADKSQLGRSSVVLLGHKVGQGEIKPLPEKILTIREAMAPNSKRTLRQFLGQAGYYSRFVKNFHSIALPLYELLRKDKKFEWTDDAQRAFKRVQQAMNEQQLTLKLPNTKETFIVATDASDRGIGAVLKQKEGVIEYASRVLTPTEQKYSTIEKECLAIVWALDKWRPYLLGQQFHVETDHKPLEWIMTARDPRGKLARWALRLQEYDFTINHVPGLSNCVADFLSRPQVDDELPKVTVGVNGLIMEQDPQTLVRLQRQDKVLRKVIEALARGVRIPTNTKDEELKIIASQWKRVGLNSAGVLTWQRGVGHPCVVVIPRQLRRKVVADCHEMAHTGCTRTYDLLQQRAYWPKMKEDVTTYVLACQQCQLLKSDNRGAQQPLQPIPVSEIGELWSMDLMGPFPLSARGNQYVLVMTEHFTRWIEATGVPDQKASTVGDMVMKHIVANHGVPKAILTDQGPCFESDEFRTRMQQLGIKRIRTTPYHPQTNGLTERNNRTVKEWLSAKGGDWESALPLVLLAYRASVQASTKKSPFQLMYGRTPRLPVDQDIGVWPECIDSTKELVTERERAQRNLKASQARTKEKSARQRFGKTRMFNLGERVKYRDHRNTGASGPGSRKLLPKWKGPYLVISRRGPVYTIKKDGETKRVHASELATWHEMPARRTRRSIIREETPRRSERIRRQMRRNQGTSEGGGVLYNRQFRLSNGVSPGETFLEWQLTVALGAMLPVKQAEQRNVKMKRKFIQHHGAKAQEYHPAGYRELWLSAEGMRYINCLRQEKDSSRKTHPTTEPRYLR
ncbi:uncharacterized protein DEA37_0001247 [Paragonimus westermani]|uniref:RNA-directed DNA polymerase n=1 Tax=Paragonimus westermani TaxID=34504 RepID=A0A5J4NND5_9TREM|nr:uncharacterized protein DEA37_0001247 [Paragonimus westermani]